MEVTECQHGEVNAIERTTYISQGKGASHTMQGRWESTRVGQETKRGKHGQKLYLGFPKERQGKQFGIVKFESCLWALGDRGGL